jgi:hypothetical protein
MAEFRITTNSKVVSTSFLTWSFQKKINFSFSNHFLHREVAGTLYWEFPCTLHSGSPSDTFFFFLAALGFELRAWRPCWAGTVQLEPLRQPFFVLVSLG